jgi:hypothetical protein
MKNARIYWNLNRDCVSIQTQCPATKKYKVIGYARSVLMANVSFVVSESGRQRAIRDGQRNVHAFAVGTLVAADWIENKTALPIDWNGAAVYAEKHTRRISYNPFRGPDFTIDGLPVAKVPSMYLTGDKQTKAQAFAP